MPRASLSHRNIERTLRVQNYLKNKEKPFAPNGDTTCQGTSDTPNEDDLDIFMHSVTDKKLVKEAEESWQKKT